MTDPKEVNILNDFASLFLSEEASGTENKKMSRCWKEERRVLTHNVVRFGPRTLVGARRVRDEFLGTAHIRRVPSYIRGFLDPLSSAHHDPRRGQKPGKLLTHPQREWACSKTAPKKKGNRTPVLTHDLVRFGSRTIVGAKRAADVSDPEESAGVLYQKRGFSACQL
nr:uncharacterized protein LOC105869445 isoform X3 [Microcebus murinus]